MVDVSVGPIVEGCQCDDPSPSPAAWRMPHLASRANASTLLRFYGSTARLAGPWRARVGR